MSTNSKPVSGWSADRVAGTSFRDTVSQNLCEVLRAVGVRQAFGIVGGGNAPFAEALLHSPIELFHARHEGGAAFAAAEASLASGRPVVVFVTTGPGLFNAITGMVGARWDGAQVILVSATTSAALRGRGCVQETSSYTVPAEGLFRAGPIFDFAVEIDDPEEFFEVARRLQIGCQRPGGYVAHLALPLALQTATLAKSPHPAAALLCPAGGADALESCAERLRNVHFAVWVGYGARAAARPLRDLVERTGAAVICTPRAKGIFPEDHPQFIGVTGAGGHSNVQRYLSTSHPREMLVLGTRMGEASSFWVPELAPAAGFIQVDIDPNAFGMAYPQVDILAIQAELSAFVGQLARRLPRRAIRRDLEPLLPPPSLHARRFGPVRPQFLMQALQRQVVAGCDALVMSESGNAFSWANHHLRFREPGRYRTSAQYGAMGQVSAGVVGAALGRGGKAVAIVGDGAMLMNNEISTAVQYGAQALWIVLNDSRYGITHHGMEAWGFTPVETTLPTTDFARLAQSVGGAGCQVRHEADLEVALEQALQHSGPFVLDVAIDRDEVAPVLKSRIEALKAITSRKAADGHGSSS